ncbi:EscU/YscU/HrcU family type III secretion system export apparatus switch protein [Verminephrobacter eiseniae]|uniref:Flagellar biosynthetic protein FlhB n=1 Tax=Verminephrobacter eiseniae (strain EF01-2) TaxID=391735 RepID=A1WGF3_VEREI|nr:EscU/YscU/HrcU family type III secretion system export apparatus switch protein [Verminephrobacter eiseniae]ABM56710.1 type III secretion exporter [Verminephrobacter eiseniae EF01-2]MCW5287067.1 EscU/YscU/HrcU family type III secretion system export apparatus switch protein [Verminephrobacter eiseniae]MCW5305365.1 EscU/YscU/HrcU family type III secretion system export apparatus switch protein [Verminephrobacter eiseniae]MCW8182645.1 EscU/YscU/HrcU family type III secretion system export appa
MPSSQEKSLPASGRKLQKARADGQGARSRELLHLAILGAGSAGMWLLAPQWLDRMQLALSRQLAFDAAAIAAPGTMLDRLRDMVLPGLVAGTGFAVLTGVAALVGALGAGGWILSTRPIQPRFSRLDPVAGLTHLFSRQQMANVLKMVLMTGVLGVVAWQFLAGSMATVAMLVLQPSPRALGLLVDWLGAGLGWLLLVLLLAALVDVPMQAWFFKARLRMSHQEVRQEHQESDGNPHTKGRIRQRQRDLAERASVGAVPRADFVVMNPAHYAVALRYDEKTMGAPQVIARGTDLLAFRIRDLAREHGVPVLQSPRLARALYAHAALDQAIPAPLYAAVAQVLAHVYRLKAALRGEGLMPGHLAEPDVPPELDPLNPPRHTPAPGVAV